MTKSFSNKTARFISTIFVPPAFTIIIFTFYAFYLENETLKTIITLVVAYALGFTAPIILFLHLRKRNLVADADASIKEQRTLPFSIAVIFYSVGLFILIYFNVSIISIAFWFCYISNTIITIFINKYWKISAHAIGASGPFAALIFVTGLPAVSFGIIVLLVGWSRIKLKCHTFGQVTAGTIFAFISVYLQMHFIVEYFSSH